MSATNPNLLEPNYATHPGELLAEWLEENQQTQADLAQRSGHAKKTINQLVKGIAPLNAAMALDLEKVTGVAASLWSNMEARYRQFKARQEERAHFAAACADDVARFSYKKMSDFGWLPATTDKTDRAGNLLHFFGVANFHQWSEVYGSLEGAARESSSFKSELPDLSAWLRQGEIAAAKIACAPFDEAVFRQNLTAIRALTAEPFSATTCPRVRELCAAAGIALVLVPELPGTHVSGFTRWLSPTKALIQQSLRHKRDDHLWFTFFHEAAHLLLHGKKEKFLEFQGRTDPKETEADVWAADFLIPPSEWRNFTQTVRKPYTDQALIKVARQLGVSPGVVAGRAQRETSTFDRYHSLFTRIELKLSSQLPPILCKRPRDYR